MLQHLPPPSPPRAFELLNYWKLAYSNSLPVRQKLCSNAPANFLLKAKSVAITFYIDHALKLRPCFRRLFGNENKIFTFKHLHIKRYNNCIPLDVLDSLGVNPYLPLDFVKTQQLQILLHNTQPWKCPTGKMPVKWKGFLCIWTIKKMCCLQLTYKKFVPEITAAWPSWGKKSQHIQQGRAFNLNYSQLAGSSTHQCQLADV